MKRQPSRRDVLRGLVAGSGAAFLAACGAQTTDGGTTAASTGGAATSAAAEASLATSAAAEASVASETAASTAPAASAAVAPNTSAVNVVYWGSFSDSLGEAEQAMVKSFNESQSDVQVEYQFQGSYEETAQKFTAGLQAQTIPDVLLLSDVWWFTFYTGEAIAPLDELVTGADMDLADYEPVLLEEGVRQEKHFWIPFARSTPLFYFNKDMFAEAGLPDRAPETWAEFGEWAPKLVQRDGDAISKAAFVHPNGASYVAWLFQGVTWQFGGTYSTPEFEMTMTNPDTLRAAQFYQDTVNKDKWAILAEDVNKEFIGGTAAAMMASTGGLAGIQKNAQFNVGVGFLPQEKAFGCPTGGAGLAIPAQTPPEKQAAAMQYVAFATNPENAGVWSRSTGYMPVRISTKEAPEMVKFFADNPNFKTAVDQLPKTRAQDSARVFVRNGDQIIGKGLERIVVNNEAPDAVFAEVGAELQEAAEPILEDLKAIEG